MLTRPWMLLTVAVVLIASHALVLRYVLQHKGLSAAVAGVMIVIAITHLGLINRLCTLYRRWSRR